MQYELPIPIPLAPKARWDFQKLSTALQTGIGREDFHHDLETAMLAQSDYFSERTTHHQHTGDFYDRWAEI
eukprot:760464-Pyramimonas_sp.AAC.1